MLGNPSGTNHSSAGNIISLYQRLAVEWDKERGKSLMEKNWLDDFLDICGLSPSILDLGCGSGEPIARYLISAGARIMGIDSSPTFITLCKERFPGQSWQVADMRSLHLGSLFNGVLAWDSFFHLPPDDQRAMFPFFRAHAAPGAALMFTSGHLYGEAIGVFHGEELYHASLSPSEYRTLLSQNGFTVMRYKENDPCCGRHTIWLARLDEPLTY